MVYFISKFNTPSNIIIKFRPCVKIQSSDFDINSEKFIQYLTKNNIDIDDIFKIEINFNNDNREFSPLLIKKFNGEKLTHEENMILRFPIDNQKNNLGEWILPQN